VRTNVTRAVGWSVGVGVVSLGLVIVWAGPDAWTGVASIDLRWLVTAVLLTLTSWTLAGFRFVLLARRATANLPLHRGVRAHLVGLFASAASPGGAGGMPAAVLTMTRQGVEASSAWSIGLAATAADLAFIGWSTPVALLVLHSRGRLPNDPWIAPVAIAVSLVALTLAFVLLARQRWLAPLSSLVLRGPLQRYRDRATNFVTSLQQGQQRFSRSAWWWHLGFHGTVATAWWCLFLVLWGTARSLSISVPPLDVVAGLTLVQGIGAVVPTPGGSGTYELGASLLLVSQSGPRGVAAVVVVWRFLTFYLLFLLGPIVGAYDLARGAPRRP